MTNSNNTSFQSELGLVIAHLGTRLNAKWKCFAFKPNKYPEWAVIFPEEWLLKGAGGSISDTENLPILYFHLEYIPKEKQDSTRISLIIASDYFLKNGEMINEKLHHIEAELRIDNTPINNDVRDRILEKIYINKEFVSLVEQEFAMDVQSISDFLIRWYSVFEKMMN